MTFGDQEARLRPLDGTPCIGAGRAQDISASLVSAVLPTDANSSVTAMWGG